MAGRHIETQIWSCLKSMMAVAQPVYMILQKREEVALLES
jgi:hypothetical protein